MDSTPTTPPASPVGDAIPGIVETPGQPAAGAAREKSYGQIVKSSALIGGATVFGVAFQIIRTKAMALILDPSGVGLLGLYMSICDLTRTVAGMGINTSGVRQIAEAVGTGDNLKLARTVTSLRRVAIYSGALGAFLLVVLCKPISLFTFGDSRHLWAVALLALAAFFGDITAGQGALIQGMRRLTDLARMSVWGAMWGTLLSIPIVYYWEEAGVVPALVSAAGMAVLTSWWYARKIKVERVRMKFSEIMGEASALLKLGVVFMASGLFMMGSAYLVRVIVRHYVGLDAAGYYQAAWQTGAFYVMIILQAMGADFYPRLTAVANDNPECNRLVNEQVEVGLLLAGPGVLGTLTFAPLILTTFYSEKFGPAAHTFCWICLGMFIRVVSWPIGFIVVAKGNRKVFFWSELLSFSAYVALVWLGVQWYNVEGAGVGFFGMYILNVIGLYLVVRRLSGFRWASVNLKLAALIMPLVALVFVARFVLPWQAAMILGAVATLGCGLFSLRALCTLIPPDHLPRPVRKMLSLLRLAPAAN